MNLANPVVKVKNGWILFFISCHLCSYTAGDTTAALEYKQNLELLSNIIIKPCGKKSEWHIKRFIWEGMKKYRGMHELRRCQDALKATVKKQKKIVPLSYESLVRNHNGIDACGSIMYKWSKKLKVKSDITSICFINSVIVSKIEKFFRAFQPFLHAQYCLYYLVIAIAPRYEERLHLTRRCFAKRDKETSQMMSGLIEDVDRSDLDTHHRACFNFMDRKKYSLRNYTRYIDDGLLPDTAADALDMYSCQRTFESLEYYAPKFFPLKSSVPRAPCAVMAYGITKITLDRWMHYDITNLITRSWKVDPSIRFCDATENSVIKNRVERALLRYPRCSEWIEKNSIGLVKYTNHISFWSLARHCNELKKNKCLDAFKNIYRPFTEASRSKIESGCNTYQFVPENDTDKKRHLQYSSLIFRNTLILCERTFQTKLFMQKLGH